MLVRLALPVALLSAAPLDSQAQGDTAGFTFATDGRGVRRETADSIISAVRSVVSQSDEDRRRRGPLRIVIRTFRDTVAHVTVEGVPDAPLWIRVTRREARWVAVHVTPGQSDTTRPRPFGAQAPTAQDTAAIRAAALTFAERVTPLRVSHIKRIVADTAWVAIYDPRTDIIDIPSDGSTTAGTAVRTREVRVERHGGKWQRATTRPRPLGTQPTARDTAEIRAAAVAFVKAEKADNIGRLRIVADTAGAIVFNPDSNGVVQSSTATTVMIGHTFKPIGVRIERRNGKWVGHRFDPSALPR